MHTELIKYMFFEYGMSFVAISVATTETAYKVNTRNRCAIGSLTVAKEIITKINNKTSSHIKLKTSLPLAYAMPGAKNNSIPAYDLFMYDNDKAQLRAIVGRR